MIAVVHLRPSLDEAEFRALGEASLAVLAARPGFVSGTLGRATDDPGSWVLVMQWESIGAYRRGLGGYDVKMVATPFFAFALDQPSAFEPLLTAGEDGTVTAVGSDRAPDADWVARVTGRETRSAAADTLDPSLPASS